MLGQLADGGLGAFGGVEPVVVDKPQPGVALGDPSQLVNAIEKVGEFLLTGLGQQEPVKRLEGSALVEPAIDSRLPSASSSSSPLPPCHPAIFSRN